MTVAALPETCPPTNFLWVWPSSAAYLGTTLDLSPHSTSVHCLAVGVEAPVTVVCEGQDAITARSVLLPPRVVHQVMVPPDARTLFCYADVTRARRNDLFSHMQGRAGSFGIDCDAESFLIGLCEESVPEGTKIMEAVLGTRTSAIDPRISRTMERLGADPAGALAAAEMARIEELSPSYFLRLFGRETGTSFRRYRLWARMLHAARAVAAGADLTRASADAGFATPSHFSDSFRQMFGLTATALTSSGAQLVISADPIRCTTTLT